MLPGFRGSLQWPRTAIDKVRDINGAGYAAVRSIPGNEAEGCEGF